MLITAVIPAFNAEPFVAEAIKSVLGQTHPQVERIVVDGSGSSPGLRQRTWAGRSLQALAMQAGSASVD